MFRFRAEERAKAAHRKPVVRFKSEQSWRSDLGRARALRARFCITTRTIQKVVDFYRRLLLYLVLQLTTRQFDVMIEKI